MPNSLSKLNLKTFHGFTLVELAVVMLILAFLLTSGFMSVSALRKSKNFSDTRKQLAEIESALYGFAIAYERLPCPAIPGNGGQANPLNPATDCNTYIGFVPSNTLGINGAVNCDGLLTDPWGRPYRYSVVQADAGNSPGSDFVTTGGIQLEGMALVRPNIQICRNTSVACGSGTPTNNIVTTNAVAVVFSMGEPRTNSAAENENAGEPGASMASTCGLNAHELSNDQFYYSSPIIEVDGNEYDDILIWISHTVLYNKLLEAGHRP